MTRLYLRVALVPFIILTTALLLVRVQPYDNQKLRTLLIPTDCHMPCFMGIRPGITNENEALRLLKETGLVGNYEYATQQNAIRFTWKGDTPTWLVNDGSYNGVLYLTNGIVNQLAVETNLRIGDFQLDFGEPPFQQSSLINSGTGYYLFYTAVYPNVQLLTSVSRDCLRQQGRINYLDKVYLSYSPINTDVMFPSNTGRTWVDVIRRLCP